MGLVLGLVGVLALGLAAQAAESGEASEPATFFYGLRLQSDMLFYLCTGVSWERVDAAIGLGFNNGVWLGMHSYFYSNQGMAVFTGLELQVLYPPGEPLELHPALPIGFAVVRDRVKFVLETMLEPVVPKTQVRSTFAFLFTMEL